MAIPIIDNAFDIEDSQGRPVPGGKVYTYEQGTTTPKVTYSDEAGAIPNTNPVILDSSGRAMIFGEGSYTIDVKDMFDSQVDGWPKDIDLFSLEKELAGIKDDILKKVSSIDIVPDLRAYTGYVGESIRATGYDNPGDGGGGPLRVWLEGAAPGTYVDDGSSVIVPTLGDGSAAWVWSPEIIEKRSVASLREQSGFFDGQKASLLGYYEPGDGGGGPTRIWKSGQPIGTYVDNSGSIIVPTGGDGSEAWIFEYSGAVNVKWYGAKGDGTTVDTASIQECVDAHSLVEITDGVYELEFGYITLSSGARISGNATLKGGLIAEEDDVSISGLTLQMNTGLDSGNLIAGFKSLNVGALSISDVVFDKSSLSISNEKDVPKKGYRILGCKFTGDVAADQFAQSVILGNTEDTEVIGNTFEQENLYRVIKTTSPGYAVGEVVDQGHNNRGIFTGNFIAGTIAASTGLQVIDLYSSYTELILSDNQITTTGGTSVILTKAAGGTGPNTYQHRNIIISNNLILTDCSATAVAIAGAYGEAFESTPQNITIASNTLRTFNPLCARGIQVRTFNLAEINNNDIKNSASATVFAGLSIRGTEHVNINGGIISIGNISIESEGAGDPDVKTICISGVSLVEHLGRGVDVLSLLSLPAINITGCSFDSLIYNPIRTKNATINNIVMTGNVGSGTLAYETDNSTITKTVDSNNSWNT